MLSTRDNINTLPEISSLVDTGPSSSVCLNVYLVIDERKNAQGLSIADIARMPEIISTWNHFEQWQCLSLN